MAEECGMGGTCIAVRFTTKFSIPFGFTSPEFFGGLYAGAMPARTEE